MIDNAFNYRQTDHMDTSEWASNPANCTTAFNQWRTEVRAGRVVADWPEFRDAKLAKVAAPRGRPKKEKPTTAAARAKELTKFKPFRGTHGGVLTKPNPTKE
jgi:hypothetical protein